MRNLLRQSNQRDNRAVSNEYILAQSCNFSKLTGGVVVVVVDVDVVDPAVVNAVVGTAKISVESPTVESAALWSIAVTVVTTKEP